MLLLVVPVLLLRGVGRRGVLELGREDVGGSRPRATVRVGGVVGGIHDGRSLGGVLMVLGVLRFDHSGGRTSDRAGVDKGGGRSLGCRGGRRRRLTPGEVRRWKGRDRRPVREAEAADQGEITGERRGSERAAAVTGRRTGGIDWMVSVFQKGSGGEPSPHGRALRFSKRQRGMQIGNVMRALPGSTAGTVSTTDLDRDMKEYPGRVRGGWRRVFKRGERDCKSWLLAPTFACAVPCCPCTTPGSPEGRLVR